MIDIVVDIVVGRVIGRVIQRSKNPITKRLEIGGAIHFDSEISSITKLCEVSQRRTISANCFAVVLA